MTAEPTYATYDEARAAVDAEYRDAASRVAAHARCVAKRLSDGIAATHPGYYFEFDETDLTREQRAVIADPGT
jgi:hypothetical protein